MGTWKLEAFRVALYMTFPVGTFWWFNQPENFEEWLIEQRRALYPANPEVRAGMAKLKAKFENERRQRLEEELKNLELEQAK